MLYPAAVSDVTRGADADAKLFLAVLLLFRISTQSAALFVASVQSNIFFVDVFNHLLPIE